MYNLSKKEYYEYQAKFARSFVGAKLLIESILFTVACVAFLVEFLLEQSMDPVSYVLLVGAVITGVGALMYDTFFMKEFHLFVNEQLKTTTSKKKEK